MMVTLQGIEKNYGRERLFNGLDLQLKPGAFYGLLGRNGAGKSTLMRILAGNESVSAGLGQICGVSFSQDLIDRFQRVGFVGEQISFEFEGPIKAMFPIFRTFSPGWNEELVRLGMEKLKLSLEKRHGQMSRGQKMQVAFLFQLAKNPQLFLIDEITSVLDAYARKYILDLCKRHVSNGNTVVIASNIVTELQNHADHLVLIEGGKIKVNEFISNLASSLVKVTRTRENQELEVFRSPSCIEVDVGPGGDSICLLPKSDHQSLNVNGQPPGLVPTFNEIYQYLQQFGG